MEMWKPWESWVWCVHFLSNLIRAQNTVALKRTGISCLNVMRSMKICLFFSKVYYRVIWTHEEVEKNSDFLNWSVVKWLLLNWFFFTTERVLFPHGQKKNTSTIFTSPFRSVKWESKRRHVIDRTVLLYKTLLPSRGVGWYHTKCRVEELQKWKKPSLFIKKHMCVDAQLAVRMLKHTEHFIGMRISSYVCMRSSRMSEVFPFYFLS